MINRVSGEVILSEIFVYDSGWFAGMASDDVEREYRELRRR